MGLYRLRAATPDSYSSGPRYVVGLLSLLLFVSLLGSLLAAGSLLASLFASLLVSLVVSLLAVVSATGAFSALPAESSPLTVALLDLRLSVTYQPEPLKTMPTG